MQPVGAGNYLWLFFGFRGRISRAAFLLGMLALFVVVLFPLYRALLLPEGHPDIAFWIGIASLASFPALWAQLALAIKRVHDFGKPGLLGVLIMAPMANLLALVAFSIIAGDKGPNIFGHDTNSRD